MNASLMEWLWQNFAQRQTESKLLKQKMLEFLGKAVKLIENITEIILSENLNYSDETQGTDL